MRMKERFMARVMGGSLCDQLTGLFTDDFRHRLYEELVGPDDDSFHFKTSDPSTCYQNDPFPWSSVGASSQRILDGLSL
jgi:hypothetical protein